MCLIIFSWKAHTKYPLVISANRDEFYQRPTSLANTWQDDPALIAGKDLEANGTWMGLSKKGRWSALTNYRSPSEVKKNTPSRGALVKDFLSNGVSPKQYLENIKEEGLDYNGFNLLVGTENELWYYSNIEKEVKEIKPGVYGLSNHLLDTSWPKVELGKKKLKSILKQNSISKEDLFLMMQDTSIPEDELLPATGVGIEWERLLSSMFIESDSYGTRCSTALIMDNKGGYDFAEKSYPNQYNQFKETTKAFRVEPLLSV